MNEKLLVIKMPGVNCQFRRCYTQCILAESDPEHIKHLYCAWNSPSNSCYVHSINPMNYRWLGRCLSKFWRADILYAKVKNTTKQRLWRDTKESGREGERERKKSMDKSNYIILELHPASGFTFIHIHIHTQIVYVRMYKFVVVTLNGIFMLIVKLCQSIFLTSNNFSCSHS